MQFGSDSVVTPNPNFVNFRIASVNATDRLGLVSATTTILGRPTLSSDWLQHGHDIEEVTAEKVSEAKAYSDYILENEFETMRVFERENISVTRPTFPISPSKNEKGDFTILDPDPLTRPTELQE